MKEEGEEITGQDQDPDLSKEIETMEEEEICKICFI